MAPRQNRPKTKEHRGDTGSKACQCNNCDIVQENIPDQKMSEQLIPVASCFPFAQRSITFVNRSDGDRCAQRKIEDVDKLDREVVALGNDYAQGFILPQHQHRRAQLLYGATGLMYVSTCNGEWVVPHNMQYGSHPKPLTLSGL